MKWAAIYYVNILSFNSIARWGRQNEC